MLNFVLCEDNTIILNRMSKMLESIFIQHNYDAKITYICSDADNLMNYVKNNNVDVLVLDINLKSDVSGIELAQKIRLINKSVYLIFTTAHLEYSLIAYKLKTFDYMPKPITLERLEDTINRLFDDMKNTKINFIKIGNSKVIAKSDDILYIKRDGMKLIYQSINRNYDTYSSFNKIADSLASNFVRCHKSYIANINNIKSIDYNKNTIVFISDDICFIGPKYKNIFMEVLENYGNYTNNLECNNNRKSGTI